MIPDTVADVGNTRIKWGVCAWGGTAIDPDYFKSLTSDPGEWAKARDYLTNRPIRWAVASVHPTRSERLIEFLRGSGDEVVLLRHADLKLKVNVEQPERVGIDRLLNAVAAISRLERGQPAVLVDAGSAVTVDWLDADHVFQGGTIFPGMELMAEALHRYTAQLPRVPVELPFPQLPGKSTAPAIQGGILHAVAGGIRSIVTEYARASREAPVVFMTGGQSPLIVKAMGWTKDGPLGVMHLWPEQTLTGILLAARGLP